MEKPDQDELTDADRAALQWLPNQTRVTGRGESIHALHELIPHSSGAVRRPETFRYLKKKPVHRPEVQGRRGLVIHWSDIAQRQRTHQSKAPTSELLQASLDMLSAQVLILDTTGTVVASNLPWQRFAAANGLAASHTAGQTSYMSLYDEWSSYCPQTHAIKERVASVLSGKRKETRQRYEWHATRGVRWFELKASRHDCGDERYVVIVNEDVTAAREAEQALGEAAEQLLSLQERERQLIAQELHDSTAQHIVAAGINLVGLRARVEQRADVLDCLERIEGSLDEACKEMRSFTYLLHPPCLEADGLAASIQRYVEGFGTRTGIETRLRISQAVEALPTILQRPLLRVIQEALGNVHRHASATCVTVDLRCVLDGLHLTVRDNGRGIGHGVKYPGWQIIEPAGVGVGIAGIRARLRQFGGNLVIKSGASGTMLHAAVPITAGSTRRSTHVRVGGFPSSEARGLSM